MRGEVGLLVRVVISALAVAFIVQDQANEHE